MEIKPAVNNIETLTTQQEEKTSSIVTAQENSVDNTTISVHDEVDNW